MHEMYVLSDFSIRNGGGVLSFGCAHPTMNMHTRALANRAGASRLDYYCCRLFGAALVLLSSRSGEFPKSTFKWAKLYWGGEVVRGTSGERATGERKMKAATYVERQASRGINGRNGLRHVAGQAGEIHLSVPLCTSNSPLFL